MQTEVKVFDDAISPNVALKVVLTLRFIKMHHTCCNIIKNRNRFMQYEQGLAHFFRTVFDKIKNLSELKDGAKISVSDASTARALKAGKLG